MGKFSQIMEHLNPRTLIEKTERPHDEARAGITLPSSTVGSYQEFTRVVSAYVVHHMEQAWGGALPPELCLDKGKRFLENSIGWDNAVFMAMSGAEGGMPNVLTQICEGFKKEAKQAWFNYIINNFIDPLFFDDVIELMIELKARLGGYSPDSFGYVSPEQMAVKYEEILWTYIQSLSRYRNLWTY